MSDSQEHINAQHSGRQAHASTCLHSVQACPECGGFLKAGKDPVDSERGFRYRQRQCLGCGATFHTKQGPEEITGVEKISA